MTPERGLRRSRVWFLTMVVNVKYLERFSHPLFTVSTLNLGINRGDPERKLQYSHDKIMRVLLSLVQKWIPSQRSPLISGLDGVSIQNKPGKTRTNKQRN